MRGLQWPNRFTHHELMPSSRRRPSASISHGPSPRTMGTSGNCSCSFIWVHGCHTLASERSSRNGAGMAVRWAAAKSQDVPSSRWGCQTAAHGRRPPVHARGLAGRGNRAALLIFGPHTIDSTAPMLFALSPAKAPHYETPPAVADYTQPDHLD